MIPNGALIDPPGVFFFNVRKHDHTVIMIMLSQKVLQAVTDSTKLRGGGWNCHT